MRERPSGRKRGRERAREKERASERERYMERERERERERKRERQDLVASDGALDDDQVVEGVDLVDQHPLRRHPPAKRSLKIRNSAPLGLQ